MLLAYGIPLFVVFAVVPGVLIFAAIGKRGGFKECDLKASEFVFITVMLSVMLDAWIALVLAELGIFSLGSFSIGFAAICVAIVLAFRVRPNDIVAWRYLAKIRPRHGVIVALAVAMIFIGGRPFEWILGGDDAGTYVNTGASIARSGSIEIVDEATQQAGQKPPGTFFYSPSEDEDPLYAKLHNPLQFIGFFITDQDRGEVVPQSLHMFPALIALAMTLLGVQGGLYLLPLLAVLGVVAVFHATRRMFNLRVAAIAALFLSVNFLQQWFARYPASEMLAQPLLFAAIYFLVIAEKHDDRFVSVLSALGFSELILVRADMILTLPCLGLFIVCRSLGSPRVHRRHIWFAVSIVPLAVHALAHVLLVATPYLVYVASYNIPLQKFIGTSNIVEMSFGVAGTMIATLVLIAYVFIRKWASIDRVLQRFVVLGERPLRIVLAATVVALAIYGYFIRPIVLPIPGGLDAPLFPDGLSMVKIGWYVSELGLILALAGTVLFVLRGTAISHLLLFIGLFYCLLYFPNPFQFHEQPQWTRKFMPVVVPYLLIAAAYCIDVIAWAMSKRVGFYRGILVAGLFIIPQVLLTGRHVLPFLDYVEYERAFEAVDGISEMIPTHRTVVLMHEGEVGFRFGTPLRYVKGQQVVLLDSHPNLEVVQAQLDEWRAMGKTVYFVNPSREVVGHLNFHWIGSTTANLSEADRPKDGVPAGVHVAAYQLGVFTATAECDEHVMTAGRNDAGRLFGAWNEVLHIKGRASRWTKSSTEVLLCPVDGETIQVSIVATGERPADVPAAEVRVKVNGELVGEFVAKPRYETHSFTFRRSPHERLVVVGIESSTWRPADYLDSNDTRELGIGIAEVRLEPAP